MCETPLMAQPPSEIDIEVTDPAWHSALTGGAPLEALAEAAIDAVCLHFDLDAVEVSVLACDDAQIATLNADFRDKPVPTNVLSWPAEALEAEVPGGAPRAPVAGPDGLIALGDIAIASGTCVRESEALERPLAHHVTHLIVHGTLHLLGYDHIEDADAALMEGVEIEILGKMGIDNPYFTAADDTSAPNGQDT